MHRVIFLLTLLAGTGACGTYGGMSSGPNFKRATNFTPAANVEGSPLATDRVKKVEAGHEPQLAAVAAVRLGVLEVVVDPGLVANNQQCWTEETVWPGASVDAAALGATHARMISLNVPPNVCQAGANSFTASQTSARYELFFVDPDRWSELPESLRPKPIPRSAIRNVMPGNWVKPPTVVEIKAAEPSR